LTMSSPNNQFLANPSMPWLQACEMLEQQGEA